MSSICIVLLQRDYEIKDIKVQTFKLKHDGTSEKNPLMLKSQMAQSLK